MDKSKTGYRQVIEAFLENRSMKTMSEALVSDGYRLTCYGITVAQWITDVDEDTNSFTYENEVEVLQLDEWAIEYRLPLSTTNAAHKRDMLRRAIARVLELAARTDIEISRVANLDHK